MGRSGVAKDCPARPAADLPGDERQLHEAGLEMKREPKVHIKHSPFA